MQFEFDDAKDASNRAKHGVSLALGALVISSPIGWVTDDRHDYGEVRINAFGLIRERPFVCTYTMRGDTVRIISVRRASRREQRHWLP
jgi:uncharacterized DUF497 family protein